jgi:hypothetical protein
MANKCEDCGRTTPEDVPVQAMVTSAGRTGDICAVCALRVSNLQLGIQREKFTGTVAEEMRVKTVRHYKDTNQTHDYGN